MAWLIVALAEIPLLTCAFVAIAIQRGKLIANQREHWEQEREIQRWRQNYEQANSAFHQAWNKFVDVAQRDPIIVQPPDVAGIVRELGESIGTAIYGRQQEIAKDLQQQIRDTSMVEEKIGQGEWFPEVEFDDQMGPMPTRGGWVNGQSNADMPPPEGQTPTHAIVNGQLVRVDGQAAFQSGVGAPMPQGGVE